MKKLILLLPLLALVLFQSCQKSEETLVTPESPELETRANCPNKITLDHGSLNELQDAIDAICEGGTITLASGMHIEEEGVVINKRLTIKGEDGAVLKIQSQVLEETPDNLDVGIYVYHADKVRLEGFELLPTVPDKGGTAVLLHYADKATVKNCTIREHYLSIVIEQSDKIEIIDNRIEGSDTYNVFFGHGIVHSNGEDAKIKGNEISNTFFGAWLCDHNGIYQGNNTHNNLYLGMILCKVPAPGYGLPDGSYSFAEFSATNWQNNNNVSTNNGFYGYLIIDGANNNHLNNNASSGNGAYDIVVRGGSCEFNFYTPPSFDNFITVGDEELTILDCGINTTIVGGTVVYEPCEDEFDCPGSP